MIRLFIKNSVVLVTFFTLYSCSGTEPDDKINLSPVDASCTEVWLQITGETGKEIQLIRDDKEIERFTLTASPMTIIDDSLQINTSYNYQVIRVDNGEKSSTATATTLDTTSHNFTWQILTFDGDAGSSILYDVAIIDENNIWAVGEIYKKDTTENGHTMYNAVHWDGNKWELKRITFSFRILYPNSGGDTIGITPITSIFAFDQNNIWFAAGTVQNWNGNQFIEFQGEYAGFSNKIWGSNSSDLYFVGNYGSIVHYQNGEWSKIESGTELNINDIYGAYNKVTNQYEILAPASNVLESLDRDLLKISGNTVEHLATAPIQGTLRTAWFIPDIKYYVAGGGIYQKNTLNADSWKNNSSGITSYSTNRLRGQRINDIIASGGAGEILHFNGLTWQSYFNQTKLSAGNYYGLDFKDNLIIAVGQNNPQAVITIGKQIN
jgi:hypothetical protein